MGKSRLDDTQTEKVIQDYLIRGFTLLQNNPCPACRTPLVRQAQQTEEFNGEHWPIPGIAYCIKCDAHVVSHVSEVSLLEAYEKKQKNTSFYVASQSTNNNKNSKQRASNYVSSSDESSGILETSITDTQMAHAPPKTPTPKVNHSKKNKIPTQPSVPGALIVDPVAEEEDPVLESRRQQQPQNLLPPAPVVVQPPPWWQTQWWTTAAPQTHIPPATRTQRVLVETTSDGSANSGVRIQQGIAVSPKPEPDGFIVQGTDVVSTESVGPRDPPLEEARTGHTSDAVPDNEDSVNDPPSHLVVSVDSFQEEPTKEQAKQEQGKKSSSQNEATNLNERVKAEIPSPPELSSHQETPKHQNAIKKSLRKSSFRRRPKFLNTVNSTDDSIEAHQTEKSDKAAETGTTDNSICAQSEDTNHPAENKSLSVSKGGKEAEATEELSASRDPWDILREEGRSTLTRRLMAGWHLSLEQCQGSKCQHFPLFSHDGQSYCAVCGGCGNGLDGAYDVNMKDEKSRHSVEKRSAKTNSSSVSVASKSLKDIQDEFDARRKLASKEVGAKMRQGWMLLDTTCKTCMMPLLTDMSQECVLCVLCGIQSGHLNDDSQTLSRAEAETIRHEEVGSQSGRHSGSCSFKQSHHTQTTASEAPSHRRDPPPSRRSLSPDGKRHDDNSIRSHGLHHPGDVIVVEDADSLMSERRYNPYYERSRQRYSRRMKNFLPSWDAGHRDSGAQRSNSPSFSVASAPQYGNPSILVADRPKTRHNHFQSSHAYHSRIDPENSSMGRSQSRKKDAWSDRSVGSSRSYHFRAPSPGLSAAVLPSAASSVYTGTSRTVKTTPHQPQPRIYPENWTGQGQGQGQATLGSTSRKSKRSEKSFRPIVATPSKHNSAKVIDVEPMRLWKEGREDVIIVGTKDEDQDEKGLEELLLRIERTKAQIEERSQSPDSRETQLKGLVDNLARSVQQLREIERR